MRILLVEDDPRLGASIANGLVEAGMAVDVVTSGQQAIRTGSATSFDVVILDVMLPDVDGFQVASRLRASSVETPIIMLTARDAVADRVRGLEVGADDYLTKPFAFAELLARVRALARRHLHDRTGVMQSGNLQLDTSARRVTVDGTEVQLSNKEFAILELLLLHPGSVLSKRQIEEHTWNYNFLAESNLVEVYVGRIRRKLAEARATGRVTTIRGAGYRYDTPSA